jgi:hypothetical protein
VTTDSFAIVVTSMIAMFFSFVVAFGGFTSS